MQTVYSSSNVHPSYLVAKQNNAVRTYPSSLNAQNASKDLDAGFDRPAYKTDFQNTYSSHSSKKQTDIKLPEKKSTGPRRSYKMNAGRW